MKAIIAILAGFGIGALVMYLFDPQAGNRRRAFLRDKAVKFNRQAQEAIEGKAKDLSNRAKGLAHDVRSTIKPETEPIADQPIGWSDGPAL